MSSIFLNSISFKTKFISTLGILSFALIFFIVLSTQFGAYQIGAKEIWNIFLYKIGLVNVESSLKEYNIIWHIRLPRILLAAIIGGSLAMVGGAFQGVFRNPLVEPGLIGVSSGSALFAVFFLVSSSSLNIIPNDWQFIFFQSFFAFVGGLFFTFLVYFLSLKSGKSDISLLILAGVAINALAGALIGLVIFHADDNAIRSFTFWSLGDLGGANWTKIYVGLALILFPTIVVATQYKALNAFSLGESEAFHLGINVQRAKNIILFMGALSVACGVSMVGIIGFVGLIVPHIARLSFGSNHTIVLPASFLMGASLLIIADLLARTIVSPAELPIGIITALVGAPFFVWLILRIKNQNSL